jgi:hypothetical protein
LIKANGSAFPATAAENTVTIEVRDSSIHTGKFNNATDEHYIKTQILAPAINWAGVFICYVSPQTKNSDWVNWEIEYAAKQGKRIVGVWEPGEKELGGTAMRSLTRSTGRTRGKSQTVVPATRFHSSGIPADGSHSLLCGAIRQWFRAQPFLWLLHACDLQTQYPPIR